MVAAPTLLGERGSAPPKEARVPTIGRADLLVKVFALCSVAGVVRAVLVVLAVALSESAPPPARQTAAPSGAAPTLAMVKGAKQEERASQEQKKPRRQIDEHGRGRTHDARAGRSPPLGSCDRAGTEGGATRKAEPRTPPGRGGRAAQELRQRRGGAGPWSRGAGGLHRRWPTRPRRGRRGRGKRCSRGPPRSSGGRWQWQRCGPLPRQQHRTRTRASCCKD